MTPFHPQRFAHLNGDIRHFPHAVENQDLFSTFRAPKASNEDVLRVRLRSSCNPLLYIVAMTKPVGDKTDCKEIMYSENYCFLITKNQGLNNRVLNGCTYAVTALSQSFQLTALTTIRVANIHRYIALLF